MSYTIKRIGKENLDDVVKVFNNTRGTNVKKSFFEKKYITPWSEDFISVIAYYNEEPVSHSVATPFTINILNNHKVVAGQVGDTVTVKTHQRQGLFKNVNAKLCEISENSGIEFLFRFPNPNTFNGLINHLNYRHIDSFYSFIFKAKTFLPILKILNKLKTKKLIHFFYKTIALLSNSKRSAFESSIIRQGFYGISHDKTFLKYKTFSKNHVLNILGDKYWIKHDDGLIVGDFMVSDEEKFIKKLKRFCFWTGIHKVKFIVSSGTKEYNLLCKYTKPEKSLPICIKKTSNLNLDFSKLKFTFADSDYF